MKKPFRLSCVLPAIAACLIFGVTPASGGGAGHEEAAHHLGAHPERPPLPMHTRIAIERDGADGVMARVTLVFPHNGYEVADWGEPVQEDNRFGVDIEIKYAPGMLPVVTELENVYRLGHLLPGDYGFVATSAGHVLAVKKFTVRDGDDPEPFPASARLRVTVLDDGHAMAEVAVVFHEGGWRIRDWGTPMRRGHFFSIHAEAVRVEDRHHEAERVLEIRHIYRLWPHPLEPGEYELQFFINGHEMAHTGFRVPENRGSVSLRVEPLTEPGHSAHPVRVIYRHPNGIATDSLGDRNIRIVGPNGYDRLATLRDWVPVDEAGDEIDDAFHGAPTAVAATYLAHAPGRVWTGHDNGHYGVILAGDSVRTLDGGAFPEQRLGGFRIDIPREPDPWVAFHSLEIVELPDASIEPEGPSYGAKLTLLVASSNVGIKWGEVTREGNRFWVDVVPFHESEVGLPVITKKTHTYRLGELRPGHYHFIVFSRGRLIGHKRFSIDAEELPKVRVLARDITEPSRDPHLFQIRFRSPHGMDLESIRKAMVGVRGPHGYSEIADLLAIDTFETAAGLRFTQASYSVVPPRHGWIDRYNGFYGVFLPRDTIHDTAGNFVPGGRAGGFHVMIRPRPDPERPWLELDTEVNDDGVVFLHLEFHPGDSGWAVTHWGEHVHLKGLRYVARAEIDENPFILPVRFLHTYELGRLKPGVYGFVWFGSNGFVSRHIFRIGDEDPMPPYERWRLASEELAERRGDTPEGRDAPFDLFHYAFAVDSDRPSAAGLLRPAIERDSDGQQRLLLTHPEAPLVSDIVYRVELSNDLREWVDGTGIAIERELRQDADGAYRRVMEIGEENGEFPFRFARVRADFRNRLPDEFP